MINVKELRIGNLVNYHIVDSLDERKEWYEVIFIEHEDLRILSDYHDEKDYKPIPLTEETLLKCGFVRELYYFNAYDINVEGYYLDDIHIILYNDKYILCGEYDGMVYEMREISGLHEIQNLYYELYRKELEVNL